MGNLNSDKILKHIDKTRGGDYSYLEFKGSSIRAVDMFQFEFKYYSPWFKLRAIKKAMKNN